MDLYEFWLLLRSCGSPVSFFFSFQLLCFKIMLKSGFCLAWLKIICHWMSLVRVWCTSMSCVWFEVSDFRYVLLIRLLLVCCHRFQFHAQILVFALVWVEWVLDSSFFSSSYYHFWDVDKYNGNVDYWTEFDTECWKIVLIFSCCLIVSSKLARWNS